MAAQSDTDQSLPSSGYPVPRPPLLYPTPLKIAVLVLAVIALVAFFKLKDRCGPGVERHGSDRECVGVTDGRYAFPGLEAVLSKIKEENRLAEAQGKPLVTLAFALPLDTANKELSQESRHELQGAHMAQRYANHTSSLNGDVPLIRLLVASTGKENRQWPAVVDQLVDETDAPSPLVAVLSLGESRETTRQAIGALSDKGIPVIAVRLSADDLGLKPGIDKVPGLIRVGPTNHDEATAASTYLKRKFQRALVIQDDNEEDLYARTLGAAFTKAFPDATHELLRGEQYNSALAGIPNTLAQMLPNICQKRPDVIFFAGRSNALLPFLEVLPRRTCKDNPITIVTGDGATDMSAAVHRQLNRGERELKAGLEANVTFLFTGLAHRDAWKYAPASFNLAVTSPFQGKCPDCFFENFPGESLDDGAAIMGYDGVVTVTTSIRSTFTQEDSTIRRGAIIQQWNRIQNCGAVAGASGWISLDELGNPINKAIPILELKSDGSVAFVELASPLGTPFVPPC